MRTPAPSKLASSLAALALLFSCHLALALDPSLHVSQYAHQSWRVRDGFAKGTILAIAQTPDGYLWLGTEFGLLRFDGVRAVPWEGSAARPLRSTLIASLLSARDGTLWIGTSTGLVSLRSNTLTEYPELAGLLVAGLAEDQDGTVWAGGFAYTPPGKLCAITSGAVHCYGEDGKLGHGVLGLYTGRNGALWAGVLDGFWRWKPGDPQFYPLAGEPNGIQSFAENGDGTLYIPLAGRVGRLAEGRLADAYAFPESVREAHGGRILRDRAGGYWVGTVTRGLVHSYHGATDTFAQADGLTGDVIATLFEDREGSIWVGTSNGLDRFSAYPVATFSEAEGVSAGGGDDASVVAASDGSVWFAPHGRLYRLQDGQVTLYQQRGVPIPPAPQRALGRWREMSISGLPSHDRAALFEDYGGQIWIAANGGVGHLQGDRFISVPDVPGDVVYAIAGDPAGDVWISDFDRGLVHLYHDRLIEQFPRGKLARSDLATALTIAPNDGTVWLGFSAGGIAVLKQGEIHASYTTADGLGAGRVSDLRFDRDATLWVATDGGFSRLKDGKITTLTMKNGLPCEQIFWSAEAQDRSVWLYGSCGLMRIERSDLDASIGAPTNQKLRHVDLFDSSDGVRLWVSLTAAPGPRPSISPDGRIWFPTADGLSVVNPRHLEINRMPPPVHIERITADRRTYAVTSVPNGSVRLPAQVRDLQIDYTALSFVVPEKVHFRYQLEGWDRGWQDAGTRRQAFYSNLPPRNYRFRVVASNNSGVWNEQGDTLSFSVAPAYWQTTWFLTLGAVGAALAVWALVRLRVRQVAARVRAQLEGRMAERERIARDLHDTLLQGVQGLLLRFQVAAERIPKGEPAREMMDRALERADEVLDEGRARVKGLRAPIGGVPRLPQGLARIVEQLAPADASPFRITVEGAVRELDPIVGEEVQLLAREALTNAYRHATAKNIEAEISYADDGLTVRIRDDGQGIDGEVLREGRPGHFGLVGMRERAKRIRARLRIWSKPGAGTEVEIRVPAAIAYREFASRSRRKRWWRRASAPDIDDAAF